jgi:hypothetical protein
VETYDAEKAGTIELDPAARQTLADPLAKLEHVDSDKRKAAAAATQIQALQEESSAKHKCVGSLLSLGAAKRLGRLAKPCWQP